MEHKYIDERYPDLFIFGIHPDGKVYLHCGGVDIATVTPGEAEKLMGKFDDLKSLIYKMADKFPEEFKTIFYEGKV